MRILVFLSFFLFISSSCALKEFDPQDPATSYEYAKEPYNDKSYEIALTRLSQYRARFPYSQKTSEVDLLIANAHYELGQYDAAAFEYDQFIKLHPYHKNVDFALYQIGMCFWADAPDDDDREQQLTKKAIVEWQKLIKLKPNSEYAKKAAKKISDGHMRIAKAITFVGDYYCKMEIYHSCANRFLKIIDTYPHFTKLNKKAHKKAAYALQKLLDQKKSDDLKDDANLFFKNLGEAGIIAKITELKAHKL